VSVSRQKIRQFRTQDVKQTHHERANGPPREVVMKRRNIKQQEIKIQTLKQTHHSQTRAKTKTDVSGYSLRQGISSQGICMQILKPGI
jgi:hypothetical protein